VYRLTNVNRSEPNRSLFEAPADYTVVETPARIVEMPAGRSRTRTLMDQQKKDVLEPVQK